MPAGAPKGNKNAEIWDEETSLKFFDDCIELANTKGDQDEYLYDFIGELARDVGQDKSVFNYLVEKFPQLQAKKSRLLSIIEANCFRNTKKGKIKEATGIVNLKSNYKWTDRADLAIGQSETNKPVEIKITMV